MTDDMRPEHLPGFEVGTRTRLQALLVSAGWILDESEPGRFEVWTPEGEAVRKDVGVVVPLDEAKGDYQRLHDRAVETLRRQIGSAAYERLATEIDAERSKDLVRTSWKREAPTAPGSIPWPQGREVFDAITRQLMAAAKAAISPMPQLGRSNAYVAQDFLAATILAPSGAGSYIVNALTPVHRHIYTSPPAEPQPDRKPRQRQSIEAVNVLATLDSALSAIESALGERDEEDQVRAMIASPGRGVSHELLSALADFAAGHEAAVITPRHAWTASLRPREVAFKPRDTPVMQRAASALAGTASSTLATITGVVTKMEHEPESEHRVVRIFTTSRGPVRRVSVHLDESDYDLAISAHREDTLVRVRGELAKVGKYWKIEDPQAFRVLDAAEEDAEVEVAGDTLFDHDLEEE
jgi:hypothetical protein